jgi:phenylacetate-CoA ligase
MPGSLAQVSNVLTSSGHSGKFAVGLSTWKQQKAAAGMVDLGLQHAFDVDSRRTLLINCLPMGVRFVSRAVTVAETSVREDMALAILEQMAPHFEQVILVVDPLFLKRLLDFAREKAFDWGALPVHCIVGEEVIGENFRTYVAKELQANLARPEGGFIGSSMGVAELGLNLLFETPQTVHLRRLADGGDDTVMTHIGIDGTETFTPMVFVYNPLRTFVEILEPDAHGYGALTISLLDPALPVPLLRYQTGDVARFVDAAPLQGQLDKAEHEPMPFPMVAVKGRDKDMLANGASVGAYKDALYGDAAVARLLTGAFRVSDSDPSDVTVDVQLVRDADNAVDQEAVEDLFRTFAPQQRPARVTVWPFAAFPYGMNLDYERKFPYRG